MSGKLAGNDGKASSLADDRGKCLPHRSSRYWQHQPQRQSSSQMGGGPVTGTLEGTSLRVTSNVITPRGTLPVKMTGDIHGDAIANGKAKITGVGKMKWTAKRRQ